RNHYVCSRGKGVTMEALPQRAKRIHFVHSAGWVPSNRVEYLYFFVVFYSLLSEHLGIQVPLLATAILAALAGFCIMRQRSRGKKIYGPVALLFACGISFILVQIAIHDEPTLSDVNRAFINWMLALVVVRSLSFRPGFPHRLTIVLFVLGLITLPYLSFETERVRIDAMISGQLTNAIGLAEWFGFCLVYFAIYGLETRRGGVIRIGSWLIAVGCLYIVAITVSRGPLLASALAITVGFRRLLRRGFVPVLVLITLTGVIYESGLFEHSESLYVDRAEETSGR